MGTTSRSCSSLRRRQRLRLHPRPTSTASVFPPFPPSSAPASSPRSACLHGCHSSPGTVEWEHKSKVDGVMHACSMILMLQYSLVLLNCSINANTTSRGGQCRCISDGK